MKAVKYLFALWVGTLVYVSFSFFFGATGISAYRQLGQEQDKLEANLESLKRINRELDDTMNALRYDRDTLSVYAREQGYASPGERFIRIVGLGTNQKIKTSSGEALFAMPPQYTQSRTLSIIAFCAGLSVIICMAFFDILKFLRERA